MKKKFGSVLLMCADAAVLLVGCSSSENGTSTKPKAGLQAVYPLTKLVSTTAN